MSSLKRWYEDPGAHSALREKLEDPIIKQALQVVLEQGQPKILNYPVAGDDLRTQLSLEHMSSVGYHTFYRNLLMLAAPLPEKKKDLPKPWEGLHIKPQENQTR